MEGTIGLLDPDGYRVVVDTPSGDTFEDFTTPEMFAQLELGMWYIKGQTQIPPQPEQQGE